MPRIRHVNSVTISGRLLAAPELRYTSRNLAVLEFKIDAQVPSGSGGDGFEGNRPKRLRRTQVLDGGFFEVMAIGDLAEKGADHLIVGTFVIIAGKLILERWEHGRWKGSRVKILAKRIGSLGRSPS